MARRLVVYPLVFLVLGGVGLWTYAQRQQHDEKVEMFFQGFSPNQPPPPPAAKQQLDEIAALEAIGYLSGSKEYEVRDEITMFSASRLQPGLNFFTSGHAPVALLMDENGHILHEWEKSFDEVFPDHPPVENEDGLHYWRRAHLFPNGDVLAIFEGRGIVKVDKDSNILWAKANRAHHDMHIMENGDIWVLTRTAHVVDWFDPTMPILEDELTLLGPDGSEKRNMSILEAFRETEFEDQGFDRSSGNNDIHHTNTLSRIGAEAAAKNPIFKEGNFLLSFRTIDMIGLIDLDQEKMVWTHTGAYVGQHDPQLTQDNELLLFDNTGMGGRSRVLRYDIEDMKESWVYDGGSDHVFASALLGAVHELDNGNLLVVESMSGRVFEVTSDEEPELVWMYQTPYQAGDQQQYIAIVPDMVRVHPDELEGQWWQ